MLYNDYARVFTCSSDWLMTLFIAVVIIKGNGYEAHQYSLLHVYFYTVKVFFDQSIQLNL